MAQHYRRIQLRKNLLEMYRDNAIRTQSYMDVVRLHGFMTLMTEIQTKKEEETHHAPVGRQCDLFEVDPNPPAEFWEDDSIRDYHNWALSNSKGIEPSN